MAARYEYGIEVLHSAPPTKYAKSVSIFPGIFPYRSDYFYLFHTSLSLVFVGCRIYKLLRTPPTVNTLIALIAFSIKQSNH